VAYYEEHILEHLVCLDENYDSLEDMLNGRKVMLVLASYGKKFPYGRIHNGDTVYFTEKNSDGLIKAKAVIKSILCLDNVSKEEAAVIMVGNKEKLNLSSKSFQKLIGKKYMIFIEFTAIALIDPIRIYNKGQLAAWTVIYT
jgi:hypothetical protein